MSSKKEFMDELVRDNGLDTEEDVFSKEMKDGRKMQFITRPGIEKIQYHNHITVTYDMVSLNPEFVVIKATATKRYFGENPQSPGNAGWQEMVVESFGESTPQNTKQQPPYHTAMAQKRSLSRVVLGICGGYKYGIMGEDEADDFKRQN